MLTNEGGKIYQKIVKKEKKKKKRKKKKNGKKKNKKVKIIKCVFNEIMMIENG